MARESVAAPVITQPWFRRSTGVLRALWRFARHKPLGTFGAAVGLLMLLTALFADVIAPYGYAEFNIPERLQGPSWDHLFGTDNQGRDVFSRIVYGAQTSVITSFGAVTLAVVMATSIGLISAYYGGLVDLLFQRVIDIWIAFPGLLFIIFLVSILGASQLTLIIVIGFLFMAGSSRLLRSIAMATLAQPYTEAAKAVGARDSRIMIFHILPNMVPIILITVSVEIGAVILIESSLSFLGYGIPPPFPSWGRMLNESQRQMLNQPYLAIFPGLAIALVVYSLNMFGDALRDVLDPRLRGSR